MDEYVDEYAKAVDQTKTLEDATISDLLNTLHLWLEGGIRDDALMDECMTKDFWDLYAGVLGLCKRCENLLTERDGQGLYNALSELVVEGVKRR